MKAFFFLILIFLYTCSIGQIITTVAGNGTYGYSGNGGIATSAQLAWQAGVIADNAGNIYIGDHDNNVVRKVNSAGIITNFAGNGILGYAGDGGLATSAQLYHPTWMGFDNIGDLYIIDQNAEVIRKVDISTGIITSITGNLPSGYSGDGGPLIAAQFRSIAGVTFDVGGNMYISDHGNYVIRKVNTLGIISTVVGTGTSGFSGDGGPASSAQLGGSYKVVFDNTGNMYIPDNGNKRIRKVNTTGIISTYAGTGNFGYGGDGGQATSADLQYPWAIDIDNGGNLYIGDGGANVVRKVATNGVITTYAGNGVYGNTGDGGLATLAEIGSIAGVSVDASGNLFISVREYFNVIRKVTNCLTASITQQPINVNLCNSGNAIFSVNAVNSTGYQWQLYDGIGWTTLTDNSIYSGSLTNTLLISGASTSMNNFQYRCILSNGCGSIFSAAALLLVNTPANPVITITTPSTSVCAATSVLFSASVQNGGSSPIYQWKKNGVNVGANGNTYNDNSLVNGDIITCSITSSLSCVTSSIVTSSPIVISVTQQVSPSITITSSATSVCRNASVTFTASSLNGGSIPIYQWKKNGIPVGSNNNVYLDNNLTNEDVITCILTSSTNCITVNQATSNSLTIIVHPDPVVVLDKTNSLCDGSSRILDAGAFSSYLWNTGSTNRTITINNTGLYSVTVTDINGCMGTDFININTLLPSPKGFLPGDTSICSHGNLLLRPISTFQTYLWNTGSNSYSLNITQPGQYWLQGKNNDGCTGIDTILVFPKDCLKDFFMPTAFTPNNDGINDAIKPILPGNVKQYRFSIYNRWGQLIFQTTDLSKRWDGTYKGLNQNGNIFVWMCTYQFENEPPQNKKGTFVLIR